MLNPKRGIKLNASEPPLWVANDRRIADDLADLREKQVVAAVKNKRQLVQRVKLFRFLQKDVAKVTTTKPIDFFPA